MDSAALSAPIVGASTMAVATATAGLTYLLTRRREREADWRELELDRYQEYVAALSGIVEGHATPEGHIRYVHAVNTLTLVASPAVVRALYAYPDYNSFSNVGNKSIDQHDRLMTALFDAVGQVVYPARRRSRDRQGFRLLNLPPDMRPFQSVAQ